MVEMVAGSLSSCPNLQTPPRANLKVHEGDNSYSIAINEESLPRAGNNHDQAPPIEVTEIV
ncbi:hypothetical protein QJS10_CPA09g01062 [Acorus calamus]|uniref:Uncharacterized protein n=1 Tax=Acorus calamus TaxID=4465 RepID=A0AAV9EA86_ACOCL|nr:hypothetical protein QJS10_CPA09g01062 [Acorus calamus]